MTHQERRRVFAHMTWALDAREPFERTAWLTRALELVDERTAPELAEDIRKAMHGDNDTLDALFSYHEILHTPGAHDRGRNCANNLFINRQVRL